MMLCEQFNDFLLTSLLPLIATASMATGIIIALVLLLGRAIGNSRLSVWAKDEVVQLFFSLAFISFVPLLVNLSCTLNANDFRNILLEETSSEVVNLYDAAELYVLSAARYSHEALAAVRYHLEVYAVLSASSGFECAFSFLGCLFGYTGDSFSLFGGYGALQSALSLFFNLTVISLMTALLHYFILSLTSKAFLFFLLPLGLFFRSLPYMRILGSVLFALALSFIFIYPLLLSIFWIGSDFVLLVPSEIGEGDAYLRAEEDMVGRAGAAAASSVAALASLVPGAGTELAQAAIKAFYFDDVDERPYAVMDFAVRALFAAVILPTLALIGALASTVYIAKFFGQQVDLSRLMQLM